MPKETQGPHHPLPQQDIPWEKLSPQEREKLDSIRVEVRQQLFPETQYANPPYWVRWGLAGCAVAMCAALLVILQPTWPTTPTPPPKQAKIPKQKPLQPQMKVGGGLQLKRLAASSAQQAVFAVRLPADRGGQLSQTSWWTLQAGRGSGFGLKMKTGRSALHLHRGALSVHVIPSRKQRFSIHCAGDHRVMVKGTRFRVLQSKTWLRVEVHRGHVAVEHPDQRTTDLHAGSGLRIHLQDGTREPYPAPKFTKHKKPLYDLAWYTQLSHPQLLHFATDLASYPHLNPEERRSLVERAARVLEKRKRYRSALRLWMIIHQLEPKHSIGRETALAAAALDRHRAYKQKPSKRCLGLYRRYLERYPKGMQHKEILYWQLEALYHKGQTKAAQKAMKRFLRRYRRAPYARNVRRLLRKLSRQRR